MINTELHNGDCLEYMKKIPIINYVKVTLLVVFTFLSKFA